MIHFRFASVIFFLFLSACQDVPYSSVEKGKQTEEPVLAVDPPVNPPTVLEPTPAVEVKPSEDVLAAAQNDLVFALSSSGGDIDSALFWLVAQNKPNAIKLATERGANINAMNSEGNRPLCIAIEGNNKDAMLALLREGAETNYLSGKSFISPLYRAALKNFPHLMPPLVQAGASLNFPEYWSSPLHLSARLDHIESIQMLLNLGFNVNLLIGNTPAHQAAFEGHSRSLKILLANGANPRIKDHFGKDVFDIVDTYLRKSSKYEELIAILAPYR